MSSDPSAPVKRDCYIGWDDYFMSVAVLSAFRSKDPNRQVGALTLTLTLTTLALAPTLALALTPTPTLTLTGRWARASSRRTCASSASGTTASLGVRAN
jgi:hypothetical protein